MILTHPLTFHLDRKTEPETLNAVQGDSGRAIEATLYFGSKAWEPPADATVTLRYRNSDGSGGSYDTMPNGSMAGLLSGNLLMFRLAPQVTAVAGITQLQFVIAAEGTELATFTALLSVQADPSVDAATPENYYNMSGWIQSEIDRRLTDSIGNSILLEQKVDGLHSRQNVSFTSGSISGGTEILSDTAIRSGYLLCAGRQMTVALTQELQGAVHYYDSDYGYISSSGIHSGTFSTDYPAVYARCVISRKDGASITNPSATAKQVCISFRSDCHDSYRGNLGALGKESFADFRQDGYYQFTPMDLEVLSDAPNIVSGGILEVRSHGGGEQCQQRLYTTDGEVWFRLEGNPFVRVLPQSQNAAGAVSADASSEVWTFTLEDGSTVNKTILLG